MKYVEKNFIYCANNKNCLSNNVLFSVNVTCVA